MSKDEFGLATFLLEYRAVLAQLLGELGTAELAKLLKSPIELSAKLLSSHGLASLAKRLSRLTEGATSEQRAEVAAATRGTIQEVLASSGTAAPPSPSRVSPAIGDPIPPRHTSRAKPPMRADVVLGVEHGRRAGASDVSGGGPPAKQVQGARPPMRSGKRGGESPSEATPAKPTGPAKAKAKAKKKDAELPEKRFLVAEIVGHERDQPLALKKQVLEVSVELEEGGDESTQLPDASLTHGKSDESITLTIQVTSEDFDVSQKKGLPLELPRRGASDGKARFDVTPRKAGRGTLKINVHKDGNFLLQMELEYSIGPTATTAVAPVGKKVHGRNLSSASQLKKRDLGMTIKPTTGGYECVVRGITYTSVVLHIDEAKLGDAIEVARQAMLTVVKQRDDGVAVFQGGEPFETSAAAPEGSRVSKAAEDKALATLARAGGALFQTLFAGKKAGADEKAIGELLRKSALKSDQRLTLQIVAEDFPVPWGVLYLGSIAADAKLSWDNFLGLRCIIEQIPLQTDMLVDDWAIASDHPGLSVGVNVNASIDEQFSIDVIKRQLAFWDKLAKTPGTRLTVTERKSRKDVLKALSGRATDQLLYLYCHAVTNGPQDPGGITESCFVFTDDERLTLAELDAEAAQVPSLAGNPLVFINACESGELRPEFYDGFIPYFMAKGARGVIGTECETPAIFATEWALRFFPRFMAGEPLGELFLDLRRDFLERHGNPLGLLYNVYCDGDTQVQPGLTF
ncbi:MAG: CHAT domain-containing protein [bacterium]